METPTSELKKKMGYSTKPTQPICANCTYFSSQKKEWLSFGEPYVEETNLRCGFGFFKVNKTANCKYHKFKQP